jgi:uncharacterized membrane protein YphA (DoxX/SURF4 family)
LILQLVLAIMFGIFGVLKSTQPISELAAQMVWPEAVPAALVRFIGVSELLGALGLILPLATKIKPWLTPLAALGLTAVMVLAALFHTTRGEYFVIPINLVLGALAFLVAWGRYKTGRKNSIADAQQ